MCFSAEADLLAGAAIMAIGVDALRHVRNPAERAVAVLPVVLGAHQVIEAFVWWGLDDRVGESVWRLALWAYLVIALAVLPVLVPATIAAVEPVASRRRIVFFAAIGAIVSLFLLHALVRGPAEAKINGHHLDYRIDLWHPELFVTLYVVATCGALLFSRHRYVRWYGACNLVAVGALAWLDANGLVSLWCLWAAVTSIAIAVHLRHADRPPHRAISSASTG